MILTEIELGAALRARRERAGWTQAELAEHADVSRAFVIDIEKGRRPGAELARVLRVIRALDASLTLTDYRAQTPEEALETILGKQ